ncbi:hypothetical protein [Christiangramia sp. SM2212]|uniref:Uncharacterized protein n=1 Tax=Christiangramia sediminicola TaxID=3073267 RepID=A0ABU1ETW0_9FLAO|nr:hypothetical protein [Christiangramia sp. SM2212]MDR5591850.1 hypothetical protein [Christiangramia sp. SM2212]
MTENKTKSSIILILLLIAIIPKIEAQERGIVQGKIIVDSIQMASGVHVINMNAEIGTTTNENGEFRILAKAGDSIYFSSVQFENINHIVKSSEIDTGINVQLIQKFNELAEVQIDDIRLSGVLSEDVTRMPKSIYEKLGMPFPKPRRSSLELAIQSASGNGPLISALNTLNGKKEMLEKAEENNKTRIVVNKGLNLVRKSFFTEQLLLNEKEVLNFLYYCAEKEEYRELVNSKQVLELVEFFKSELDSFKELRELD